ncbi:uncharacterized protein LOC143277405 isoform X1 [Babylonia areolata]|uniref:uncharacterized protein LOC143277405 isoform X1 n=1 Tax=Babylonia areolata TaxID=304850 RepID=UPI003FD059E4
MNPDTITCCRRLPSSTAVTQGPKTPADTVEPPTSITPADSQELKDCRNQIAKLTEENRKVVEENRKLAENRKVVEENRKLAEENRKVVEENRKLAEQYRKLAEQYTKLAEQYRKLAEQKLAEQNTTLAEQNTKPAEEYTKLDEQNTSIGAKEILSFVLGCIVGALICGLICVVCFIWKNHKAVQKTSNASGEETECVACCVNRKNHKAVQKTSNASGEETERSGGNTVDALIHVENEENAGTPPRSPGADAGDAQRRSQDLTPSALPPSGEADYHISVRSDALRPEEGNRSEDPSRSGGLGDRSETTQHRTPNNSPGTDEDQRDDDDSSKGENVNNPLLPEGKPGASRGSARENRKPKQSSGGVGHNVH